MSNGVAGRPLNASREDAVLQGFRTYTGSPHSKCGTTERYTKGGACVHCARIVATEQREALKYQQAQAAGIQPQDPLDSEPGDGLTEQQRYDQSIEDELM